MQHKRVFKETFLSLSFFFFDFADSRKKLEIEDLRIECCFTVFSLTSKNTCQKLKKVLLTTSLGFPGGSDNKASACNVGDRGSIPGSGRSPGEGNGNPLQHSCLEKSHGRRSLIGYIPWGLRVRPWATTLSLSTTSLNIHLTSSTGILKGTNFLKLWILKWVIELITIEKAELESNQSAYF